MNKFFPFLSLSFRQTIFAQECREKNSVPWCYFISEHTHTNFECSNEIHSLLVSVHLYCRTMEVHSEAGHGICDRIMRCFCPLLRLPYHDLFFIRQRPKNVESLPFCYVFGQDWCLFESDCSPNNPLHSEE